MPKTNKTLFLDSRLARRQSGVECGVDDNLSAADDITVLRERSLSSADVKQNLIESESVYSSHCDKSHKINSSFGPSTTAIEHNLLRSFFLSFFPSPPRSRSRRNCLLFFFSFARRARRLSRQKQHFALPQLEPASTHKAWDRVSQRIKFRRRNAKNNEDKFNWKHSRLAVAGIGHC